MAARAFVNGAINNDALYGTYSKYVRFRRRVIVVVITCSRLSSVYSKPAVARRTSR